jgi:RNA polymerase sigma factor (sigma-70 family)
LTEELIKRCAKHINKLIEATLARRLVEEAYTDAINEVFSQILDVASDRCDFAQVRFWFWLDRVLIKVLRRYWKQQARDWETVSLDDERDEAKQAELWQKVEAKVDHSDTPEMQAINSEALSILEPEERMLFMLRYYEEMEIENKDPAVMTISKYFGISDRAVRYRLVNIKEKLRRWTEGAS